MGSDDRVRFTIQVDMQRRWVAHFLSLLKTMQFLGSIGGSRVLAFYADGDGDFRPKFTWDTPITPVNAPWKDPAELIDVDVFFDAG